MTVVFNKKQKTAYDLMVSGANLFLTGPAGTGKTLLIKKFKERNYKYKKIAITSTTGTSALLINGTTLHSYLGIGLGTDNYENMFKRIYTKKWLRVRWEELDVLVIDEVSMLHPTLFDILEKIAREIRKNILPFGGIQLILAGDLCQLPCVGVDEFCINAKSWDDCIPNVVYLSEIVRQSDPVFQSILNNVRMGILTPEICETLDKCVGKELVNEFGVKPTRLYSTNKNVNRINESELDLLAEDNREFYEYEMKISVFSKNNQKIYRDKFLKNNTVPEIIQLCVGCQVMLVKNLDLAAGLANGSRGVITDFISDLPVVRFLNGEERIIDYNVWEVEEDNKMILSARQIPLKVAFAISIHKSQGCSLDYAEMDLSNIFEFGQIYVALSRIRNLSGLSIIAIDYDKIVANPLAVEFYNCHK